MQTVAVITPNTDTFTNPTMTTLFHLLAEKGVAVYLFGPEQQPACPDNIGNVSLVRSKFMLYLFRNPLKYKEHWKSYLEIRRIIREKRIKTLLAVDPLGLIIGGRIKRIFRMKVHLSYLSFEIFFKNELSGYYLKMKEKEISYSQYIDSLLTQDTRRKELLLEENNISISDNQIALVPVSPLKIDVKDKPDLHRKFGIPKEKKLAVYSGSVGEWCGTKAIIEAYDKGYWNQDFHLIFHTRKSIDEGNEFYAGLKRLDDDVTIPFTLHPHPFDSFEALSGFLSGFDVALALYYPNNQNPYYGMNMKEIGLSSGKFSTYMMLGLPTIVTPCKVYEELIKEYKIGALLNNIKEFKDVLTDSNFSKENALNLYENLLTPKLDNYVTNIL